MIDSHTDYDCCPKCGTIIEAGWPQICPCYDETYDEDLAAERRQLDRVTNEEGGYGTFCL